MSTVAEVYSRLMSSKDFWAWFNSEAGLRSRCMAVGYDQELCAKELKQLGAIHASKAQQAWEDCLGEICEEFPEATPEARVRFAEKRMVERFVVPPHWRAVLDCPECGFMPARDINSECAWCEVTYAARAED